MIHLIKFLIEQAARKRMLTRHQCDEIISFCVAVKGELK
jgi:hypothetical protein